MVRTHVNKVVIMPDEDQKALAGTVIEWGIERVAVTGTVVAVPDFLHFSKKKGSGGEYESRMNSSMNCESLEYDTDMELKVGDKVMFRFHSQVRDRCPYGLLVGYDQVYAKVVGDKIIPVNGRIFGKLISSDPKQITHAVCKIQAVGKPVRAYKFDDTPEPKGKYREGQKAWIKNAMPLDYNRTTVVFHRKDILALCD